MKAGSLVECMDNTTTISEKYKGMGAIYPKLKIVYTVREIRSDNNTLLLEEVDNSHLIPFSERNREPGFAIKRFRELQPPISNIEEHINLNSLEYEI